MNQSRALAAGLAVVLGGLALGARAALRTEPAQLLDEPQDPEPAAYDPAAFSVPDTMNPESNVAAFLAAIRKHESADNAAGYRMLYGGRLFDRFDAHPAALGWKGERLPDAMCRAAGFGPGCVSTAAGAYQIILPTWQRTARRLGLADFTPASQDAAALELIREAGGLDLAKRGKFDQAINAVRRVWASMPAAGWGQGEASMTSWRTAYINAGGTVA